MNKNILKLADGGWSAINIFNILAVLVAAFEIWQPFIPAEYLPYAAAALATITVIINTFFGVSQPVKGFTNRR